MYVHRLDFGLYSHPKEFLGNGVRTQVNSNEKMPSTGSPVIVTSGVIMMLCCCCSLRAAR